MRTDLGTFLPRVVQDPGPLPGHNGWVPAIHPAKERAYFFAGRQDIPILVLTFSPDFLFLFEFYLFLRERERERERESTSTSGGEADREGDTESKAGSRL